MTRSASDLLPGDMAVRRFGYRGVVYSINSTDPNDIVKELDDEERVLVIGMLKVVAIVLVDGKLGVVSHANFIPVSGWARKPYASAAVQ